MGAKDGNTLGDNTTCDVSCTMGLATWNARTMGATMCEARIEGREGKEFELNVLRYVLCDDGGGKSTRAIVDGTGLTIATGFHGIGWRGIVAEVGNDLYVSGGIKAKLGSLGQTGSMVEGRQFEIRSITGVSIVGIMYRACFV